MPEIPTQQSQIVPGCPTKLHSICEGPSSLWLVWDRPESEEGGTAQSYIIERRLRLQSTGQFGPWELVGTTCDYVINLTEQPQGVPLEYRVKAVNAAGESIPSQCISVVLA